MILGFIVKRQFYHKYEETLGREASNIKSISLVVDSYNQAS